MHDAILGCLKCHSLHFHFTGDKKSLKESMKFNWNFLRRGGVQPPNPHLVGYYIAIYHNCIQSSFKVTQYLESSTFVEFFFLSNLSNKQKGCFKIKHFPKNESKISKCA